MQDRDYPLRLRIRRCDGNKDCWLLVSLRDDGSERDSYGSYRTSYLLDIFFKHPDYLTPRPGDQVEFTL